MGHSILRLNRMAKDAILAYGIRSALAGQPQPEAMTELKTALEGQFSGPFPWQICIRSLEREVGLISRNWIKRSSAVVKVLLQNEHVEPYYFWMAGLCFFNWINQSNFKPFLTPRLAAWLRVGWKRILTAESFRLSSPRQTVPPIEEVLAIPVDDSSFIAKLILAASEAVSSPLTAAYRNSLKAMAEEASSP